MNALIPYDQARLALSQAKAVDDVKDILDKAEAMRVYARRAENRDLEIDAAEIRMYAERRLGQMIAAQKVSQGLARGGQPYQKSTAAETEGVERAPTLADVGISHKLSAHAQKMAAVPPEEFQARVDSWRDEMSAGQARVTMDLMRIGEAAINGARAVMGSREEPDDSLDFFATPPWATRALIEHVFTHLERRGHCKFQNVWEPACGEGHMAEVLREYFLRVVASDIHDYGYPDTKIADFLKGPSLRNADWIITNPPFGDVGESFVLNALDAAGTGVAMFMRVQWLDSIGRYERIFRDKPPTLIAFFAERVNLCKGHWDPEGSTATAYMWLVWINGAEPRAPFWIPPSCRETLTKPDDVERFTQHPVMKREHKSGEETA